MNGLYEDGKLQPLLEHSVARRSCRQNGIDRLRFFCAAFLLNASFFWLMAYPGTQEAAAWHAAWNLGAAVIAGISGRVGMLAWERWIAHRSGYTRYLLHRGRRLAPVHLLSLALVLAAQSLLASLQMDGPLPWPAIADHLLPIFPSPWTNDVNPAWSIMQTVVLGTLLVPVLHLLKITMGGPIAAAMLVCFSGFIAWIMPDPLWANLLALLGSFCLGGCLSSYDARTAIGSASMAMVAALLGATSIIVAILFGLPQGLWMASLSAASATIAGGKTTGTRKSSATAITYPLILFSWPILTLVMAMMPATDTAFIAVMNLTLSALVVMILSLIAGKYVEQPVDRLSACDAERAHESARNAHEVSDFTSNSS